jgi:hypothetical protein
MSDFVRPTFDFSDDSRQAVLDAHGFAVANGGNYTYSTAGDEALFTAQDLLCAAGEIAVDVAMLAQTFEAASGGVDRARALRDAASGMARLTARALEVHARDTGYDRDVWIQRAYEETEYRLFEDRDDLFEELRAGGETVSLARTAASKVFSALACAPADRMGVPGHIAEALGISVTLVMIARAAEEV